LFDENLLSYGKAVKMNTFVQYSYAVVKNQFMAKLHAEGIASDFNFQFYNLTTILFWWKSKFLWDQATVAAKYSLCVMVITFIASHLFLSWH